MKTTSPLSRNLPAWIGLLLALILAVPDTRGAPPDPTPDPEGASEPAREDRFGKRVLNFFKKIGDRDEKEKTQEPDADNRPRVSTLR